MSKMSKEEQHINRQKNFQGDWQEKVNLTFDQESQPPKMRGEKIFNALSWGLFGWAANAAVSIKLADVLENRFRPTFIKGGEWMANSRIFTTFFKSPEQKVEAKTLARGLFSVMALLPGGYIVLAPVKWMEDRKVGIVKALDKLFGPSNPDENTQKLTEARHNYIEAAPKLNWWDMINGRTVPVLGVVATHFALASNKTNIVNLITGKQSFDGWGTQIEKNGEKVYKGLTESRFKTVRDLSKKYETHLDNSLKKHIARNGEAFYVEEGKLRSGKDRLRGYANNISVDVFYSALVAFATFVIGHISAFKREGKQEVTRLKREGAIIPERYKNLKETPVQADIALETVTEPNTKLHEITHEKTLSTASEQARQAS